MANHPLTIGFRVSPEMDQALRLVAHHERESVGVIVRLACKEYLERHRPTRRARARRMPSPRAVERGVVS